MIIKISVNEWVFNFFMLLFSTLFRILPRVSRGLDPCPLCTLQRACMAIGGGLALIAALHNPEKRGFRGYAIFQALFFRLAEYFQVDKSICKAYRRI